MKTLEAKSIDTKINKTKKNQQQNINNWQLVVYAYTMSPVHEILLQDSCELTTTTTKAKQLTTILFTHFPPQLGNLCSNSCSCLNFNLPVILYLTVPLKYLCCWCLMTAAIPRRRRILTMKEAILHFLQSTPCAANTHTHMLTVQHVSHLQHSSAVVV